MAQEIRTINQNVVDQKCNCKNGYMRPTGLVTMNIPPSYEHSCSACRRKEFYNVRYPLSV